MVSTNSIFVFRSNFERSTARFNLFTKTLYISSGHCSLSLFLIVTVGPRQLATSSVNIGAKLRSDIDANSCIMNDTAKGLYSCVA